MPRAVPRDTIEFEAADADHHTADLPPAYTQRAQPRLQRPNPHAIGGMGFASTQHPERGDVPGRKPSRQRGHPVGNPRRAPHDIDVRLGSIVIDIGPRMKQLGIVALNGPSKGRPNLSALTAGTGLGYDTCFYLLRKPEAVRAMQLDTLRRLCEFLRCQPGDILTYSPRKSY